MIDAIFLLVVTAAGVAEGYIHAGKASWRITSVDGKPKAVKQDPAAGMPSVSDNFFTLPQQQLAALEECIASRTCAYIDVTAIVPSQKPPYGQVQIRKLNKDLLAVLEGYEDNRASFVDVPSGSRFTVPYVATLTIDAGARRVYYPVCSDYERSLCRISYQDMAVRQETELVELPFHIAQLVWKGGILHALGSRNTQKHGPLKSFMAVAGHPVFEQEWFYIAIRPDGKYAATPLIAKVRNASAGFYDRWATQPLN